MAARLRRLRATRLLVGPSARRVARRHAAWLASGRTDLALEMAYVEAHLLAVRLRIERQAPQ